MYEPPSSGATLRVVTDSPEWQDLQRELEALARDAKCFNAYVFDAWENPWCAAHSFTEVAREDLLDLVRAGTARARAPLHRGGVLDSCLSGRMGHAYLKTYASCYVLVLRFSGPFDEQKTRAAVSLALPRLEALTVRLPPSGGPGSRGQEAAKRG